MNGRMNPPRREAHTERASRCATRKYPPIDYQSELRAMEAAHGDTAFDAIGNVLTNLLRDVGAGSISEHDAKTALKGVGRHMRRIENELKYGP